LREAGADDLAALKALLSRQTSADAASGGAAFLHAFHDLLSSLVGHSLTERLLRSVWIDFMGDVPPAQDL
jgi:DNA-binding GntR family transcriptional regulator